jgi:hypothetical protein
MGHRTVGPQRENWAIPLACVLAIIFCIVMGVLTS